MMRCSVYRVACVCAAMLVIGTVASAQPQTALVEGRIQALAQNMIRVVTEKNNVYTVAVEPSKTKLTIRGTAEPGALRPGMLVRFNAVLDEKGMGEKPIEKLTIFTPYPNASIGVFKEKDSMFVAGQLKSVKDGKLTVAAKQHQIGVELAENVQIDLELSNLTLAKPQVGDAIKLTGKEVERGKIVADSIDITLSAPLGAAGGKQKARAARKTGKAETAKSKSEPKAEP
ncbi:MAG: hypothetical protein HY000_37475 [Planctomycetes bacterium]|nr:hypothetical protein [Planctomycetota bacterium]